MRGEDLFAVFGGFAALTVGYVVILMFWHDRILQTLMHLPLDARGGFV